MKKTIESSNPTKNVHKDVIKSVIPSPKSGVRFPNTVAAKVTLHIS